MAGTNCRTARKRIQYILYLSSDGKRRSLVSVFVRLFLCRHSHNFLPVSLYSTCAARAKQPLEPGNNISTLTVCRKSALDSCRSSCSQCRHCSQKTNILTYLFLKAFSVRGGRVVPYWTCDWEVVGSNPTRGCRAPTPTRRSRSVMLGCEQQTSQAN